jgi:endonuclease YncB( thermonuclease family)
MLKRSHIISISFFLVLLFVSPAISAPDITGKVVGVSDGDTITVLQNNTEFKIRLYGIDCPEKSQDFGNRAKQFTSGMVFGKAVQVLVEDTDRYGRTVGTVMINGKTLNEELVKAGFAWVYSQYCKKPICNQWKGYEETARNAKIGLWSQPNPTPPWEFRHGAKITPSTTPGQSTGDYHGNTNSMIFHAPGCKVYNCKNCTAVFITREEAIGAGYKPCGICNP